jgi:hypothetical protein
MKRIRKLPTSIGHLEKIVCGEFLQLAGKALSFQYVDSEGDAITLTTQEGLKEAKSNVLKLTITIIGQKEESKGEDSISWEDCLKSIVKEELNNKAEDIEACVNKEELKIINRQVIHERIECSNCGVLPIKGVRYNCTECAGYNLCERCETKEVHIQHVLLKLVTPEVVRRYKDGVKEVKRSKKKAKKLIRKSETAPCHRKNSNMKMLLEIKAAEEKINELMGTIIGDNTKEICGEAGKLAIVQVDLKNLSEVECGQRMYQ